MLVLSRKTNETIRISDDVVVTVIAVDGGTVKIGVDAPAHVSIHRGEVYERIREENRRAALSGPGQAARLAQIWRNREKRV